jgi:hypothetical protein
MAFLFGSSTPVTLSAGDLLLVKSKIAALNALNPSPLAGLSDGQIGLYLSIQQYIPNPAPPSYVLASATKAQVIAVLNSVIDIAQMENSPNLAGYQAALASVTASGETTYTAQQITPLASKAITEGLIGQSYITQQFSLQTGQTNGALIAANLIWSLTALSQPYFLTDADILAATGT